MNPIWPPPPRGREPAAPPPDDPVAAALFYGWRLLLLGLLCAPPVFLPLAVWQGVLANRARVGSGKSLLLVVGGVTVLWASGLLLTLYLTH